jgi:hypothetical protein
MELIEHKYLPQKLNDIILPNKGMIIEEINTRIKTNKMNLLIIGNHNSLKNTIIQLIVKEYYNYYKINDYSQYILNVDCFNDINLSNETNDIKTFCKTIKNYKKFIIIDNFDIINENNQQYIKMLIDNNIDTFFIFGCDNTNKINEIIQTRVYPIMLNDYGYNEYNELIETIMEKEEIYFDKKVLLEYNNLSPYFIFNLFNKLKLLKLTNIDNISEYIYIIDNKDFDTYTSHIIQKNIKEATNILFNLFDKGMSLLDIYYFLYEYYKTINQTYKYKFIEQICKYIKYIYDGYDNKIMLLFITNDIINIYNNI